MSWDHSVGSVVPVREDGPVLPSGLLPETRPGRDVGTGGWEVKTVGKVWVSGKFLGGTELIGISPRLPRNFTSV